MSHKVGGNTNFAAVTVTTAVTLIVPGRADRLSALVQNTSTAANLFVGTSTSLTTSNGHKIIPSGGIEYDDYNGNVYGRVASGSLSARYSEVYN